MLGRSPPKQRGRASGESPVQSGLGEFAHKRASPRHVSSVGAIRERCLARIKSDRESRRWRQRRRSEESVADDDAARRRLSDGGGDCDERVRLAARALLADVLMTSPRAAAADALRFGEKRARDEILGGDASSLLTDFEACCDGGDAERACAAMTCAEEAELMAELESELRAYEAEEAARLEREVDSVADELADEAFSGIEQAGAAYEAECEACDELVLCPCCGQGWLAQCRVSGEISCGACALSLQDHCDGLTLAHLRAQLAHTFEAHANLRCVSQLLFRAEQRFGPTILFATCDPCAFHRAVL